MRPFQIIMDRRNEKSFVLEFEQEMRKEEHSRGAAAFVFIFSDETAQNPDNVSDD